MGAQKTRRLTIALPADHYIFSLPKRERIPMIRRAIDVEGSNVIDRQVVQEIHEKIMWMAGILSEVGSINLQGTLKIAPQPDSAEANIVEDMLKYFSKS